MVMQTPFSLLLFGKNFTKIRTAVPRTVVWYFCGERKKQKAKNKQKKSVKHIRNRRPPHQHSVT